MSQVSEMSIKNFDSQDTMINYFTIRFFMKNALILKGYKPSKQLANCISFSNEGAMVLKQLKSNFQYADDLEIEIALFLFSNTYIDSDKTQWEKIIESLDNEIITGNISYPWAFDNILYNKFFNEQLPHVQKLSEDATLKLMKDTPQGVYQLNNLIVGPLGMIYSQEKRFFFPTIELQLWHCEDPTCFSTHLVKLYKGQSVIYDIVKYLEQNSFMFGNESEYPDSELFGYPDWYEFMHLGDLTTFLGEAFSEIEIKNILKYLINNHSKSIRPLFPKNEKIKGIFAASADDIIHKLGKPECLQLILLLKNELIVEAIEILIEEQTIVVPNTEIREARSFRTRGILPIKLQCSKFGIRAVYRKDTDKYSYNLLRSLIATIFDIESNPRRLHWKLRDIAKDNIYEKLDLYLFSESPEHVIKNLILDDPEYIDKTFQFLKFGNKRFPKPEEEEFFIEKVLWKLGFNINIYPTHEKDFWKSHDSFFNIVQRFEKYEQQERDLIRSVGVNYFVTLEGILNNSLSFITWVLFEKHTEYKTNLNFYQARSFLAEKLNNQQEGISEPLIFDAKGNNTLFPLIKGFELLAEVCDKYLHKDRNEFKRTETELPGFYKKIDFITYPFIHNILLFDIREEDIRDLITVFRGISASLEKANVCNVRNRIKHDRPVTEFPQKEEFIAVLDAVNESIKKLEQYGIVPTVFMYSGSKKDRYGRELSSYLDYQGNEISMFINSLNSGMFIKNKTLIIINSLHFKNSIEKLRFSIKEESEYSYLWEDYPKRRIMEDTEKENNFNEILI